MRTLFPLVKTFCVCVVGLRLLVSWIRRVAFVGAGGQMRKSVGLNC
jgi:hypothetical protein